MGSFAFGGGDRDLGCVMRKQGEGKERCDLFFSRWVRRGVGLKRLMSGVQTFHAAWFWVWLLVDVCLVAEWVPTFWLGGNVCIFSSVDVVDCSREVV